MSKGSSQRPFQVSNQEYSNRWDAIFGRDNEKKNEAQDVEFDRPNNSRNSRCSNNPEGQAGQTQDS